MDGSVCSKRITKRCFPIRVSRHTISTLSCKLQTMPLFKPLTRRRMSLLLTLFLFLGPILHEEDEEEQNDMTQKTKRLSQSHPSP